MSFIAGFRCAVRRTRLDISPHEAGLFPRQLENHSDMIMLRDGVSQRGRPDVQEQVRRILAGPEADRIVSDAGLKKLRLSQTRALPAEPADLAQPLAEGLADPALTLAGQSN